MLIVSPRPSWLHQWAVLGVGAALNAQLPGELVALPGVEVVLESGPAATVRVPDILVTRFDLVADQSSARCSAADIALVVEVAGPGSGRTDRVLKVADYERAGIDCYWIVDPVARSVVVLEVEGGTYVIRSESAIVDVTRPVPLHLDLVEVLARR